MTVNIMLKNVFFVNICRVHDWEETNSSAMVCLGRVHDWEEFTDAGPHSEFCNSRGRRVMCLGRVHDWKEFTAVGHHSEFCNSK